MVRKKAHAKVHESIISRFSPFAFSNKPLEPEKIVALFEASRWAPSSFNEQPWRFIYALCENQSAFDALLGCLVKENRVWAKNASMLVLTVAKMNFSRTGKLNKYAFHDVGLATSNMLTQATFMGLVTHPMGGFSAKKAKQNLLIPEGFEPVAMIAVGYHGDFDDLPDELKSKELRDRTRKPQQDIVYSGKMD